MSSFAAAFFRKAILLEAGAAIIFFGSLIHQPNLARKGTSALDELKARGYEIPTRLEPVRVYPGSTKGSFSSKHAGGWRPGVISLRGNPQAGSGPEIYMRHELMHEANFRTCSGKMSLWAEEAAAMSFSGEVSGLVPKQPTEAELTHLREKVRIGANLDAEGYGTLLTLVSSCGWPQEPCAVSREIARLVSIPEAATERGFSYILINLISGRVLESKGNLQGKHPPGSLLKIPYAASLKEAPKDAVGRELTASDTEKLLKRKGSLELDRYRLLISVVSNAQLGQSIPPRELPAKDDRFWRQYLGERGEDGNFPLEASLEELALILRASLLSKPDRFSGLSKNGFVPASTLFPEPEQNKKILKNLHALSKTGTVSDERGNPIVGHLMVAWPAEDPMFLAIFRSNGCNGASNIRHASRILEEWSVRYPSSCGKVRVRLLTLTPRSSWEAFDECPSFERIEPSGRKVRISTCGRFRIISSAKASRSERFVWGLLESIPNGEKVVLETDTETYADAVLSSEAQDLTGEAGKALRAVIVWNAAHGRVRHHDSSSLCDSTHCMVFQGDLSGKMKKQQHLTDPGLLALLDGLALKKKLNWLPFSEGGAEKWERRTSYAELKKLVDEPAILDLRRERTKTGDIMVHLIYAENEESVPCEVFRDRLKLPSCPETIRREESSDSWLFQGIGKGHGQGLSVENARALDHSGYNAAAILQDAYK